jgi:hypothetical protein
MRSTTRYTVAFGAIAMSVVALLVSGTFLDGQSTAQVVVEPVPPRPGAAGPQALPPMPVVDVPDLMRLFNKPLYMSLKEKMMQQPANQAEWDDLTAKGLQAAEIANLVALREVDPGREAWIQGAAGLQRAGVAFADASKTGEWNATRQAYVGLLQTCNQCHQARAPQEAPQLKP